MIHVLEEWLLLPQRIAVHEPSATAVVADVHLGYSMARRRQGDAVPVRSVRDELEPLFAAAQRHDLRGLIVAGDLFECGFDAELVRAFLEVLAELRLECRGVIPGNHDRGIERAPASLNVVEDCIQLGNWRIVHGDQPTSADQIVAGHCHPAVRRRARKLPCFLLMNSRLILPAFSLDAAGVDVDREARWNCWTRYLIKDDRVLRETPPSAAGSRPSRSAARIK